MSKKTELADRSLAKATEVLRRWQELESEDARLRAKLEAAVRGRPKRSPTAKERAIVQTALKKYDEMKKIKQVLKHRLAAMGDTSPQGPEAFHVYEKMLTVLDRNLAGLRELDRLLDELAELGGSR